MIVSRRGFLKGGTTAAAIMAFPGPRSIARAMALSLPLQDRPLLLHNNENPMGPGDKVIAAMNEAMDSGLASLYGLPSPAQAICQMGSIPNNRMMIGCGSTQLLRSATKVFTSKDRPLVTAAPSYEEPTRGAELFGSPVVNVPLDGDMMIDLDAMVEASKGAGLVFFCNPNNPTATVHGDDVVGTFLDRVLSESDAKVIVDEAYHDYVTDPNYKTQIPRALENDRIIVTRTFSKAHGMAGMRIGWCVAHPDAIRAMRQFHFGMTLNAPGLLGAQTSIQDPERILAERDRNTAARKFTIDWFKARGLESTDSQTNFIFTKIGIPAAAFRSGCEERNIKVGRDFPPYQNQWTRISIGTMDEMRRAVGVFGQVLEANGQKVPKESAA